MNKPFKGKHFMLFVLLSLFCCMSVYAQEQTVTVNVKNVSLREVFRIIEKQTTYRFSYRNALIDNRKDITISKEHSSVNSVLNEALEGRDLEYKIISPKLIVVSNIVQKKGIEKNAFQGQKKKISGIIKDALGEPVIGASIFIKSTDIGTISDVNGEFNVEAPIEGELRISCVGYKEQQININSKQYFNIILSENVKALDEVVVVGYGSQLQRSVTGAIVSVNAKDIEAPNAVSADNLLQGKVAGLSISQNSAQPGTSMSINIRGELSPNGSNDPLYVIDGVVISSNYNKAAKVGPLLGYANRDGSDRSPLSTFNPNDIASITVLKDASATAIYGSQAANGVIIITTKKGKSGKPTITYSGSFSVQGLKSYYDMLNAQDYMKMANLGMKENWLYDHKYAPYGTTEAPSSGWTTLYTDEQLAQTKSYNHFKDITRTGWIDNHDVSLTAGSENFKIYASLNYFDQKSLLKTTDLERFSGRINMDVIFNHLLKLNLSSMYTYLDANNPSIGMWRANANEANQVNAALYFSPRLPLKDKNGNLTLPENALTANPLAWSYMKDKTTTKRVFFAPNFEIKILPFLKANVQISIDKTDENRDMFSPTKSKLPAQIEDNFGGYSNAYNNNYGMEEYITFDKRFGKNHYLNAVLGTGYYVTSGNNYSVTVYNFPSDALENNYLELSSDVEHTEYSSDRWKRNKLSYFGRLNYTFKERYILGATIRRDGSSVFAVDHKWGWFPGVSAAWNISGEKFMKNIKAIDYLKLRAGYGTTGNESILTNGNYSLTTYGMATGAFFYYGGTYNKGIVEKQKGNKNLKWETDYSFDSGLDFSLFNDHLSGSVDYYVRTAKDLLDFAQLPTTDMVAEMAKNIGKTRSTGYEVSLKSICVNHKDWGLNTYFNFSHNHSYWVERNPEVSLSSWIKKKDDLTSVYGWRTKGIFHSLQEIQEWTSNGKVLQPNAYPGNKRYVDVNHDGVLDDKDIVRFGNTDPKLRFGLGMSLRYKRLQLDVDTYGALNMLRWDQWIYRGLCDSKVNTSKHVYDVWTSFNTNGWYPGIAADVTGNNNESGNNDFTMKRVNYLRIKNLKLTYMLPQDWLRSTKLASNANIYFDLQNTALLTNYEGLDPEMEQNCAAFPIPYTLVFGVNITF